MNRIRLAWLLVMIDVGISGLAPEVACAEEQVEEADQEPEDDRAGDRAEDPGGAAESSTV